MSFAKITDVTSGAAMVPESKSASFTAAAAKLYLCDTSAGVFTATLPTGAANGQMRFVDSEQTWATNALTITPATGEQLSGLAVNESLICDVSGSWVELVWDDTNDWWTVTSNGAVNAAAVEYASNSGTWDADDDTTFTSGSSGATIPATNLTTARTKRVRFSSTIATTDDLVLEFEVAGRWVPAPAYFRDTGYTIFPLHYGSAAGATTEVGATIQAISGSSTDVYVRFGRYAARYNNATDVGWATAIGSSTIRWRVRKTSGRSVSYPEVVPGVTAGLVAAEGLKGRTDGVAVASGYVGEKLTSVNTGGLAAASIGNTAFSTNAITLTLTAGVWLVGYDIGVGCSAGSGGARLNLSTDGAISGTVRMIWGQATSYQTVGGTAIVNTATASQTLALQLRKSTGGDFEMLSFTLTGGQDNNDNENMLWAIRIA